MASEGRPSVTRVDRGDPVFSRSKGEGTARPGFSRPPAEARGFEIGQGLHHEAVESPEELRSRLAIREARAAHEIWREKAIRLGCLGAVATLVVACLLGLLLPGEPVEAETWGLSALTGIASGVVGFALGQGQPSSEIVRSPVRK